MTIFGCGDVNKIFAKSSGSEISAIYEVIDGKLVPVPITQWENYKEVQNWEDTSNDLKSIPPNNHIISPQSYACVEGWEFSGTQKDPVFYKIVEGTHYLNKTKDNITVTSTFTGSHSKSSTASASLEGGWGPISAEVGYNAQKTVKWTSSEAVKITIRPNYEGWNNYGTERDIWVGTYYYLTSSCKETNSSSITVYIPKVKAVESHTRHL